MTTRFLLLLVSALFLCNISFAKIFRVGYNGLALAGVDYTSVQLAQNAAAAGDTIQIYGTTGNTTITKQLVIMGFGYNFDANLNLQAIGTNAPSNVFLYFDAGSDGCIVSGLSGTFVIRSLNGTPISNINFLRCNGSFSLANYIDYGAISNIKIISCVVQGLSRIYTGASAKPIVNLQMYNSILLDVTLSEPGTSAFILNCVSPITLSLYLNDAGVLVKNCVLANSGSTNNINTVYENNFFIQAQPAVLPVGSNNRWGQSLANLFNRLGGTGDAPGLYYDVSFDEDYYALKAGSPAINGGFNAANAATDCGIYGGEAAYIYKLSGVPDVPAIYKLTAPGNAATANPYNVTISVRCNN